jgi:predicted nucleic acid-binding protein
MARPVLVDSCWYITQAKTGQDPLRALSLIAESRDVAVCGMVKAEVGRGLRVSRHLEMYERAWSVMLYVDSNFKRWEETMRLAWHLDRQGINLPIQDVHIAVCAAHIGAVILTYDQHFKKIPGIDSTDQIY